MAEQKLGQDSRENQSPPPSPPSLNGNDSDLKYSRKREREASQEPTPTATKGPFHLSSPDHISARTPAKKNRTQLDKTNEEEDISTSRTPSPSPSPSPPQGIKVQVRQISQGVEDLSWKKSSGSLDNPPLASPTKTMAVDKAEGVSEEPAADSASSADKNGSGTPSLPSNEPKEKEAEAPAPAPKLSGFMAYAATSSPFASVKGSNIFSSSRGSSSVTPAISPSPSSTSLSSTSLPSTSKDTSAPSQPTATKRTGFEAFASSSSPFASVARAKSPALGSTSKLGGLGRNKSPSRRAPSTNVSAFSSYAGVGVNAFVTPAHKRAKTSIDSAAEEGADVLGAPRSVTKQNKSESNSDSAEEDADDGKPKSNSFSERLRAGRDEGEEEEEDVAKPVLQERDVITGEEDEETIHQVRGKLYLLEAGAWKERGTGLLKLNVRRSDGEGARIVMRKEGVYTLLLNVGLFKGMHCSIAQDPRYLRLSVIEEGATIHYNLRVGTAKMAADLLEEINANIPGDSFHGSGSIF